MRRTLILILGALLLTAAAVPGPNYNDPGYWEGQTEHPASCYKHEGSSTAHGVDNGDGSVTLNPFDPSWPGDHWELLVVKGGSVDNGYGPGNAVYDHPSDGVAYFAPLNAGGEQSEVSHWIVCKGEGPPPTTTTTTTTSTTSTTTTTLPEKGDLFLEGYPVCLEETLEWQIEWTLSNTDPRPFTVQDQDPDVWPDVIPGKTVAVYYEVLPNDAEGSSAEVFGIWSEQERPAHRVGIVDLRELDCDPGTTTTTTTPQETTTTTLPQEETTTTTVVTTTTTTLPILPVTGANDLGPTTLIGIGLLVAGLGALVGSLAWNRIGARRV